MWNDKQIHWNGQWVSLSLTEPEVITKCHHVDENFFTVCPGNVRTFPFQLKRIIWVGMGDMCCTESQISYLVAESTIASQTTHRRGAKSETALLKGPLQHSYPSPRAWMTFQILSVTGLNGFLPLSQLYDALIKWMNRNDHWTSLLMYFVPYNILHKITRCSQLQPIKAHFPFNHVPIKLPTDHERMCFNQTNWTINIHTPY